MSIDKPAPIRVVASLITVLALLALCLAKPSSAQEQDGSEIVVTKDRIYHTMRLSIYEWDDDRRTKFIDGVAKIRSCEEAREFARAFPATLGQNRFAWISRLPKLWYDLVDSIPTGQASPVLGNPEDGLHALLICNRYNDVIRPGVLGDSSG